MTPLEETLLWYYDTEDSIGCRSAERQAEPTSAMAGAGWWIPPMEGTRRNAIEEFMVARADIGRALRHLHPCEANLVRYRIKEQWTWARLGQWMQCRDTTALRRYNRALLIVGTQLWRSR